MNHSEQVGLLLKAVHGVYADDELTRAEREEVLADVFDDYSKRTGRNALKDLAGAPVARITPQVLNSLDDDAINELIAEIKRDNPFLDDAGIVRILTQRVAAPASGQDEGDVNKVAQTHALAETALWGLAAQVRKAQPGLSEAQAFARAVRENRDVFRLEREASRAKFAEQGNAQSGASLQKHVLLATRDAAIDEIWKRADEMRRIDHRLTREQAFAKAYSDPANRDLARAERSAAAAALHA